MCERIFQLWFLNRQSHIMKETFRPNLQNCVCNRIVMQSGDFSNYVFLTVLIETEFLDLPWKERSPTCRRRATIICTPLLSSVLGIFACSADNICLQKCSQGLSDVTSGSFAEDERTITGKSDIFLAEEGIYLDEQIYPVLQAFLLYHWHHLASSIQVWVT